MQGIHTRPQPTRERRIEGEKEREGVKEIVRGRTRGEEEKKEKD